MARSRSFSLDKSSSVLSSIYCDYHYYYYPADDLILVLFPNRATIGNTVIRSTSTAARRTGCIDSISVYFSLIRFLMSES